MEDLKGVRDHCLFLKQISDASNIRRAIINCFEQANVPNLKEEDIRNTLSFVVVGGKFRLKLRRDAVCLRSHA